MPAALFLLLPADNALTYLPESLGGLTNLQSLRAANNTLVELPDSLADLETLTTLDLSLNRLKAVPKNLGELCNLRQLGLFAAFSHSLRTEGSSTVKVLASMT
jgi:Leucine-rich repeat (LRR) protein